MPTRFASFSAVLSFLGTLLFLVIRDPLPAPLLTWKIGLGILIVGLPFFFIRWTKTVGFSLVVSGMGILLAYFCVAQLQSRLLHTIKLAPGSHSVTGKITTVRERNIVKTVYVVEAESIDHHSLEESVNFLVDDRNGWPKLMVGDTATFTGKTELVSLAEDGNFGRWMRSQNMVGTVRFASISDVHSEINRSYTERIAVFHDHINDRIARLVPEPAAALVMGLLTGDRSGISPIQEEEFRRTGLSHILAISGFNITLILTLMESSLCFVPKRWRILPSGIGITVFVLFVGPSASVVRAAVMGMLGFIVASYGRQADRALLILWSAALMLAWNPLLLRDDAGFQLSFFSVIGIACFAKPLKELCVKIPEFGGLREGIAMTLSAQITTTPWLAYTFGQLSLIAPLSNILVASAIPLTMALGSIALIADLLSHTVGRFFGALAMTSSDWIIGVTTVLSALDWASIPFTLDGRLTLLCYALMANILLLRLRLTTRT